MRGQLLLETDSEGERERWKGRRNINKERWKKE